MRHNPRLSPSVLCLLPALVVLSILIVGASRSQASAAPEEKVSTGAAAARVRQSYGSLPLSFEPNLGQADARVQFLARNSAYSLYLTADEIALALRDPAKQEEGQTQRNAPSSSVLRIKLLGASRAPRAAGLEELEGKSNYLVGRDPARWHTNVPNYGRVRYEGVYPGVDVVYYGTQRQLEYDFHIAPGADADLIRLRVEGAKDVRIDANGDLVLLTPAGEVRQHAPRAFQEIEGVSRTVACRYVLRGADHVGFEPGAYEHSKALVIDPILSYSTFLGGSKDESADAVGVAGINVNLSGTRTATTQTDASGNYVFTSLPANGTYTVTPATSAVYSFAPASAAFNTLRFNETANFAATRRLYQVGGSALDPCGRALSGVTLSLTHDGVPSTT
jgi:hypothetical protein